NLLKFLIKNEGYSKQVVKDELQAYILSDLALLRRNKIQISQLEDVHKQLNTLFNKFYKR
ncbi:MAG: hypothetical protein AABY22_23235, partial [Nanoarchaeota archaeon]